MVKAPLLITSAYSCFEPEGLTWFRTLLVFERVYLQITC
jgi:hypothetical protein